MTRRPSIAVVDHGAGNLVSIDPTLISRCAGRFGRQAVVVAIDARAVPGSADLPAGATASGTWEVVVKGGREATGLGVIAWAQRAVDLGAGELLVTSVDRDGSREPP